MTNWFEPITFGTMNILYASPGYLAAGYLWAWVLARFNNVRNPFLVGAVVLLWPFFLSVTLLLMLWELGKFLLAVVALPVFKLLPKSKGPQY